MSDVLEAKGIEVLAGWNAENIEALPSDTTIVVGNVCRKDNPEAVRAAELGLKRLSMPGAIASLLIPGRRSLVIAGTHGKTTTTALLGSMLLRAGLDPTVLVGGVVPDLGGSSRLGEGSFLVIEGDEYDSAFFEKVPKFWSYLPHAAIVSSVEHDHLDIYPDVASYEAAFAGLVERMDPEGLLAVWAGDERALYLASEAPCRVVPFALSTDEVPHGVEVEYTTTLQVGSDEAHRLSLQVSGPKGKVGGFPTPMAGEHNARNALGAAIICHEVCDLSWENVRAGLAGFGGVALRQQLVGASGGVRVYRDFAHHPRAVFETLKALRPLASPGRLVASFEPRSATACRRIHQEEYVEAFEPADEVVLAPVGRPEIPIDERLDTVAIARELGRSGGSATAAGSIDETLELLLDRTREGDLVVLMSNGHFGRLDQRLLAKLSERTK